MLVFLTPGDGICVLFVWLHRGDLLILGGLFDGGLLADNLLQPLQPGVLSAQVPDACLTAVEQGQGVDVLQLRVANTLVHHQVQQLVCSVVQHLIVLPEGRKGNKKRKENTSMNIAERKK